MVPVQVAPSSDDTPHLFPGVGSRIYSLCSAQTQSIVGRMAQDVGVCVYTCMQIFVAVQ